MALEQLRAALGQIREHNQPVDQGSSFVRQFQAMRQETGRSNVKTLPGCYSFSLRILREHRTTLKYGELKGTQLVKDRGDMRLKRTATMQEFHSAIVARFPHLVGTFFDICCLNEGDLVPLSLTQTLKELKHNLGKNRKLFLRPKESVAPSTASAGAASSTEIPTRPGNAEAVESVAPPTASAGAASSTEIPTRPGNAEAVASEADSDDFQPLPSFRDPVDPHHEHVELPIIERRQRRHAAVVARHQVRAWTGRATPDDSLVLPSGEDNRSADDSIPMLGYARTEIDAPATRTIIPGNVVQNDGLSHAAVRAQQDALYEASLATDRRREMSRLVEEAVNRRQEQEVLQEEQELDQLRLEREQSLPPEPQVGESIRLTIRGGASRRFRRTDPGEVLRDFVGSQAGATRYFAIRTPGVRQSHLSWDIPQMSIEALGFVHDSTFDVQWNVDSPSSGGEIPFADEEEDIEEDHDDGPGQDVPEVVHASLEELLAEWQERVQSPEIQVITVSRDRRLLWEKCMDVFSRRSFDPTKKLKVQYRNEAGEDGGGLTRHFFESVLQEMFASPYLEDTGEGYEVVPDMYALVQGKVRTLGLIVASSIFNGGPWVPALSHTMVQYGLKGMMAATADTTDQDTRDVLEKLETLDAHALQADNIVQQKLEASGIGVLITEGNKRDVGKALVMANSRLAAKLAMLDAFWGGAELLGLQSLLKSHGNTTEKLLCFSCGSHPALVAEDVIKMLKSHAFGEVGSNNRRNSEKTIDYFEQFINDCEEGQVTFQTEGRTESLSVGDVLRFLTGSSTVPPGGFGNSVQVHFTAERQYPQVSTCVPMVTLPIHLQNAALLRHILTEAVVGAPGFERL